MSDGKKYRARINVSFGKMKDKNGKDRPMVNAGDVFTLDDPELTKRLLAEGSITEDLKEVVDPNAKPGDATFTDPSKAPANVTKNAAEMAGDMADQQSGGRGRSAGS